jgi:predicted dehydrogenase
MKAIFARAVPRLRLIQSGEIGMVLQVQANFGQDKFRALKSDNWRLSSKEAPAGPMTATGIHLLDLSTGVFGKAECARERQRRGGPPLGVVHHWCRANGML